MIRIEMIHAAKFFANRDDEIRLAVFHCIRSGINSDECRSIWVPMWIEVKEMSVDARTVMRLIETAASISRMKTKWMEDDSKASILSGFPACEWICGGAETAEMMMRWKSAGGVFYGPAERMIAPKYDPIWASISDYGVPWSNPMILYGRDYVTDVTIGELRGLNLIYNPCGWVSDVLEAKRIRDIAESEKSGRNKIDPAIKEKLLEELRRNRAARAGAQTPQQAARDAAARVRREMLTRGIEEARIRMDMEHACHHEALEKGKLTDEQWDAYKAILKVEDDIMMRNRAELKTLDTDFENSARKAMEMDVLRKTPLDSISALKWTGDPLHPKDFEFIDPALPTADV